MEELENLRKNIEAGNYEVALAIVNELEEMSKDDKINKIESYMTILLIHLVKRHAEKRTTRSREVSIQEALRQIHKINKRRKSGDFYLSEQELQEAMDEAYPDAVLRASLEAFEGTLDETELQTKLDEEAIKKEAPLDMKKQVAAE